MVQPDTPSSPHRDEIIKTIRDILTSFASISAAYLYGSFLQSDTYHDIDLGVYLKQDPDPYDKFKLGNRIGQKVEQGIHPRTHVDVRILNNAPVSFTYEVISTGTLLIRYLDMQPWFESLDRQYLEKFAG